MNECNTGTYEQGPEHQHTDNTPEQDPVLVDSGNAKEGEYRRDDEDIVHRERLLNDVAGKKFEPGFGPADKPDPAAKGEGHGHVHAIEQKTLFGADFLLLLMQE